MSGDGSSAPGRPSSALDRLMRVQELDTAISQLEHRKLVLPERVALSRIREELAALTQRASDVASRRDELAETLTELQRQVDALEGRRRAVSERMYAARGSAARDLQAMDDEVHHLAQRQRELEDEELEAMEEQEPLDVQMGEFDADRVRLDQEAAGLRSSLAEAEATIDAELSSTRDERRVEFDGVPEELAGQYERLRAKLGGTGAARLVGNRCEGCHLELPAVEIDRIRRLPEDAVVTCDQCGRILVRAVSSSS